MDIERIRRAYGAVAGRYIDLFGTIGPEPDEDVAFIERHLAIRSGPVLDLGCGPGHLTGRLHALGTDATGVDPVPEFIAHAKATHPGVPFRLGSMDDPGVADHSVAGVLSWFSTIHLPPAELDRALAGFRRLLTPGGTLVLGFFEGDEVAAFDHRVATAYRWPAGEVARRLTRAGFTEADRRHRPGDASTRPYAAIAATA